MAKQQNQPIVLRLEFPIDAKSTGNKQYEQRVVAVASKGQNTVQGSIQFYLDGNVFGTPTPLNADGRATKDFFVAAGTHNFGATLTGTAVSGSEMKAIPSSNSSLS